MKNNPFTKFITHSSLALALAFAIASPSVGLAASPKEGVMPAEKHNSESHVAMQERHNKMMAEMKAQDDSLTAQVSKMNSAPKDKKLDLMAAIVTQMVEQRSSMNERMETMRSEMMAMKSDKEPMSKHTMMKGMGKKPKGTTEEQ